MKDLLAPGKPVPEGSLVVPTKRGFFPWKIAEVFWFCPPCSWNICIKPERGLACIVARPSVRVVCLGNDPLLGIIAVPKRPLKERESTMERTPVKRPNARAAGALGRAPDPLLGAWDPLLGAQPC